MNSILKAGTRYAAKAAVLLCPAAVLVSTPAGLAASADSVVGVYACPVPFKAASGREKIEFRELPSECEISIFTVSGLLVRRHQFDAAADISGLSMWEWDLKDGEMNKVGSGLYLYFVRRAGSIKSGKLLVIR